MSANVLLQQETGGRARRAEPTPPVQVLQKCYETATFPLAEHFPVIDQWLAEHAPDLWRQIRQEDDELFRLRQLGVPLQTYQAELDTFVALCEQAERFYAEMQPATLSFPLLAPEERVAVYCEFGDGTLLKVSGAHK
ncbi:MAG: hypothetical protein NZ578_10630 [Candidatus Binatia bacterium]|nr:hypothetical protein [Candidatus Binatia bacterium]